MIDISVLNEDQKEAVLSDDKYLRIVAGAGSGKTRVLTMRIVHLVEDKAVWPSHILAITFTNKAANEMKDRIRNMMPDATSQAWISTIHSLCVRILREDIMAMGWPRNFTVLDADDQKSILREAYKQLKVDAQTYSYGSLLDYISNNKSADISVERAFILAGSYSGEKIKAQIYEYYVKRQNDLYALDFDDLILWTVRMFRKFPEILAKWQKRFSYIHVDEFQDIDNVQYELIRQLTGMENSLYVVGDPDQTIYTWRGADVNIILNFVKDYPTAKTIMLNQNYRSTAAILNGANSVIKNNKHRLEKDLFSNRESEEKITHYASAGDEYEAQWIAQEVKDLHKKGKEYHDMAILYRSNYLSRSIEKAMLDQRIPYVIYGGVRFYERQEIKDALCYLRMVTSADDLAFRRVINQPKRGIGNKTMDAIESRAREKQCSMYEVIKSEKLFTGKAQNTLEAFVKMVESWRTEAASENVEIFKLFEKILDESGLKHHYEENQEMDRVENLKELIDDVKEFSEDYPESTLDEYLQLVSLYGDRDETMSSDYIQLMTVHAAKGLEFDTVFVTDMNEGIFPNERAMNDGPKGVEEERRLAYVAFTRAKNKLYITEAGGFSYILQKVRTRSRFLDEIDESCIEHQGAVFEERNRPSTGGFLDAQPVGVRYMNNAAMPQFKKGEEVVHTKFGTGVVLSCSNGFAKIMFAEPFGVKNIAAGHPSLKRKADAEMEAAEEELFRSEPNTLSKGEQVIHAKFGEGIVLSCKNGIADIAFPYPHGIKKIAAAHPSLKKKSEIRN
ncbi:MAG: UvrD-helicase domain-containing protein [Solobacterium sp.]|nr:UvrD-helicase domain-containing protein [Solobacterium sp.]